MAKRKILFMIPLLFLLIATLAACGSDDETIATVNGEEIMKSDWEDMVEQMSMQYEQFGIDLESEEGAQYLQMIEEQALDTLIQQEALLQAAQGAGIEVSDETVNEEIDALVEQYPSEEEFEAALEEHGYTEDEFFDFMKEELVVQEYIEDQQSDIEVTEEDLDELYEQYKAQFEDSEEEEPEAFEDVKDDLEQQAKQQQEQEQFQTIVEQAVEEADVEILIDL